MFESQIGSVLIHFAVIFLVLHLISFALHSDVGPFGPCGPMLIHVDGDSVVIAIAVARVVLVVADVIKVSVVIL